MKAKAFKIVNLILAVLVCVFALSQAFAWFAEDMRKSNQDFNGSSASPYFASGDGLTEKTAFVIKNKYHLYNLAWLQNTGKLTQKYYFKLSDDITELDMEDFWLPPIGTDDHPFQGYFNGNGKQIINLKITTDSTKLTSAVSGSSVKYSNAVGMFGMTEADTVKTAKIYNFNLINPIVEVANSNAVYADSSTSTPTVGFAVGFANCGAEKIGVLDGKLAVKKNDYTTKNSIIGGYDGDNVNGDEIDGDIGSDGDTGQFIPDVLMEHSSNFSEIMTINDKDGKASLKTNTWIIPDSNSGDSGVGLGAFSIITDYKATTIESRNISSFTYYSSLSTPFDKSSIPTYAVSTDTTKNLTVNLATTNNNADAENIRKKVLKGETELTQLTTQLYFEKSPEKNFSVKDGEQVINHAITTYYETGNKYSDSISATVYNSCIKVRVKKSSTKIFVIASSRHSTETRYLGVYKVSDSLTDFSARVNEATYVESFTKSTPIMRLELPGGSIVACEFELTGSGAGTYQLNSTGSGINFHYVSVTGTTEGDSGSTVTDPKLKDIDFIYRDDSSKVVLIENADATNVLVKFTTSQLTYLYFYRPVGGKDTNNYTLDVEYNGTQPTARSTGAGGNCNITLDEKLTI